MYFSLIVTFLLLPGIVNLPAMTSTQTSSCPGIHAKSLSIRNSTGTIACELFEPPAGFPREYLRHATCMMAIEIQDTQARCDFVGIPAGERMRLSSFVIKTGTASVTPTG